MKSTLSFDDNLILLLKLQQLKKAAIFRDPVHVSFSALLSSPPSYPRNLSTFLGTRFDLIRIASLSYWSRFPSNLGTSRCDFESSSYI